MKYNPVIAAGIAIPAGLVITIVFIWLFAIEIATLDQLSEFPNNWDFMDLIANGFAIMMFGGATRAIYRMVTGKYNDPSDQDSVPFDR